MNAGRGLLLENGFGHFPGAVLDSLGRQIVTDDIVKAPGRDFEAVHVAFLALLFEGEGVGPVLILDRSGVVDVIAILRIGMEVSTTTGVVDGD